MPEPLVPIALSHVPADTARAVRGAPVEPRYLAIGDSLANALGGPDLERRDGDRGALGGVLPAMVTLLQFDEGLSDMEAVDAVRTRLGWKYALHLPLDYSRLECCDLSEYRSRLRKSPWGRSTLRAALACVQAHGVCADLDVDEDAVEHVLASVDLVNRADAAATAMSMALEALAATHEDWLRTVSMPHWYERYGGHARSGRRPRESAAVRELLASTESDIAHLLKAVDSDQRPDLEALPEIASLRNWQHAWRGGPGN